jgi:biopolymer transport protein ExbD
MGMARLRWLEQGSRPSVAARRRTAQRRSAYYSWLDVSALFAVLLVILIAFMLNPQVGEGRHGPGVDLAESQHFRRMSGSLREDALRLVVTRDGKLYFRTEIINRGELPERLRDGVRAGAENRLYLLVDSRTKYAEVKPVLDEVGLAGVKNISFLTEPAPANGANP